MKKALLLLLVAVLAVSAFACNKKNNLQGDEFLDQFQNVPDDGKPSWEFDQSEYDFTWYLNASWMEWPTNGIDMVSRVIREKTGCNIEILTPADDSNTELSTMISSGSLPDVISVQAELLYANQLADQGYVYSLDTLMERFAPSMKPRYHEQQRDVYDWFKRGGQLYGIPNLSYSDYYLGDTKLAPNGGILVREDWYNEVVTNIGEDMTTKESFIKGCAYIKSRHANAIPVQLDPFIASGNQSVLWLSEYFAVPFEKENGEYNYQITDPRYEEVLTFLNSLYTGGYIADANLTANTDSVTRNLSQGNVFVSMATPQNYNGSFRNCFEKGITYVPLVLRNDAGDDPVLRDLRGKGYLLSMITRKSARPDKIIKVFDFLTSEEGQLLINFGVENDTFIWDANHEKIVWTEKYLADYENNDTTKYGFGLCNMLLNQAFFDKVAPAGTAAKKAYSIYINNLKRPLCPYSHDYNVSVLMPDTTRSDYFSYVEKRENVNNIWGRFLPGIISSASAGKAIEKYNSTVASMKNNDLDFVVGFMNDSYARAKTAMSVTKGWPPFRTGYTKASTGPNGDFSYWQDAVHA
ncbi:hypothetical protein FACS1894211_13850 [Clostridia bacterium]|nr:hypothetical protein FACS1894211_13850 [Clostridia bacterium]